MDSRSLLVLGLALAGTLLVQPRATAQTPSPDGEGAAAEVQPEDDAASEEDAAAVQNARQHYSQGTAFFDGQRYAEAAAEFEEAYRIYPNVIILYALGQAYEGTLQVHKAIEAYRQYLESAPTDDERRADVESRIQLLERLLATIHVESNVPAQLFVDGEARGEAPGDVEVATGRHEIVLRAEGYSPGEQTVIVAAGTEHTATFELQEARLVTEREIIRVEGERTRIPRAVFWSSVGATAGAAGAWVALASIAKRRVNQYDDLTVRTPSARDDAEKWNVRADILLGVTGALGALTLTLGFFTDWGDDASAEDGENAGRGLRFIGGHVVPGGAVLDLGGAL